jgi:Lrp/AsnC family transcriptional regulator, leucine-responsive regulatory protein
MNNNMQEETFKIDNLDRKILYELDRNSRQSASQISKKLHVHKNVINFRINRLVEKGVIRQFVSIISPSVLGLIPCKIYLQMQNLTDEKQKSIIQFIQKLPLYWAARVSGRWDFILGVLVKDMKEFNEIKNRILEKFGEDITNKTISILVESPYYYREYLVEVDTNKKIEIKYWLKESKKEELDEKDIEILRLLANNSRIPVVEITEKVNLTVKTIISRIKYLKKSGIIADYRISLNLNKIGYSFFKCFISLKKADKKRINDFLEYCHLNKNIIHLVECVGDWDFEPEFEIESFEKFQQQLSEIRNKFSDIIKSVETINILEEYSYVCIPEN